MSETSDSSTSTVELGSLYTVLNGSRLFTEKMFQFAMSQITVLSKDDSKGVENAKYMDFNSHIFEVNVKTDNGSSNIYESGFKEGRIITLGVYSYQELSDTEKWKDNMHVFYQEIHQNKGCPIFLIPQVPIVRRVLEKERFVQVERRWDSKYVKDKIGEFLEAFRLAKGVARVDKIVCLGLHSMEDIDCEPERTYQSHRIAIEMEKVLREKQGRKTPIPMFFEDEHYSQANTTLEKHYWSSGMGHVNFVAFPDGLRSVNGQTLVLAHGDPYIPYRQIIADLTREHGGPAGIFCRAVEPKNPEEWTIQEEIRQYKNSDFDPANRHVADMIKDYLAVETLENVKRWDVTLYLKQES